VRNAVETDVFSGVARVLISAKKPLLAENAIPLALGGSDVVKLYLR